MGEAKRLDGKRAVISGAGSGIGRAAAKLFAAEGARVALLDVNAEAIEAVLKEIGPDAGAIAVPADVTDEAQVEAAVGRAVAEFGGLDTVVPNAGVQLAGQDDRADRLSLEVWQRTIDINLTGQFLVCKHGLRALVENGAGAVVCTASPTGQYGVAPGYDAYSASKGGVLALTRVMARDYATDGVRVNALMPGFTETGITARAFTNPGSLERITAGIPLGRAAHPDEIAAAALFLASDESSYVTGAILAVDGGQTAI